MNMRVGSIIAIFVALSTATGIGVSYRVNGSLNACYCLMSLFFSVNLLVCYWEMCLFWRRDYVEKRVDYWREYCAETGRSSAAGFMATEVPLGKILSPTIWADAWASYSLYDGSYADRRTYGFNVDIANGFVTVIPSLILYATYTVAFLPALVAGILGAMLFWQWVYMTSVYVVSFYVAGRHKLIRRGDTNFYILGINSFWVVFALLGLYISIRLIVDGDYSVLGHI